jgi:chromosomal replication initiation ATPase DnaA
MSRRGRQRDIEIGVISHRLMQDIIQVTGLRHVRIIRPTRRQPEVAARFALWWLTREITGASYPELARVHGYDHTTILNGVRKAMKPGSRSRAIVLNVLGVHSSTESPPAAAPIEHQPQAAM